MGIKLVGEKEKNTQIELQIDIKATISITTLNMNGLNIPIKRQRLSKWIKKQEPTICYLQETHFKYIKTCRLK